MQQAMPSVVPMQPQQMVSTANMAQGYIPVAYPTGVSNLPYATFLQHQQAAASLPLGIPHSSMGSAGQSFPSMGVPINPQQQQVQINPQQQQLLMLQQQGKLHSTAVAAQLGVLTNTMTGVVGGTSGWVAGHSAPAGPAGGLPGAYPQHVTGPLNLTTVQQAAPAYASIATPDGGLGSQLVWEVPGNAAAAPLAALGPVQPMQLATYDQAALSALGTSQLATSQGQLTGNAALWNATTAAVLGGSGSAASLPLQQALQAQNGSSSNSSYLEVPLSFS